jgi:NADPH2:quinone reductase
MNMQNLQLRSLVRQDNTLELSLVDVEMPEPGPDEVIVSVEATPLNPSDLALLLGAADISSARVDGSTERPVVTADIPVNFMKMVSARLGQSLPVGNEGAGTVIAAGSSDAAQALLGKTVGMAGGEMFARYRCMKAMMCLELPEGTSAADGASCFVNPMTALGMVETMRAEGHTALVHTAAASNLGQMLNRCNAGIRRHRRRQTGHYHPQLHGNCCCTENDRI